MKCFNVSEGAINDEQFGQGSKKWREAVYPSDADFLPPKNEQLGAEFDEFIFQP